MTSSSERKKGGRSVKDFGKIWIVGDEYVKIDLHFQYKSSKNEYIFHCRMMWIAYLFSGWVEFLWSEMHRV